ncbi:hypothetical protein FB451DRAFT_1385216 [Mycena latifolia]|nr:hypothetical protein FB451DRAFT_1385216 [Mycena latifolia]
MGDIYDDSTGFIEDRNRRSYHDRHQKSRWSGVLPKPTFIFGKHAPLDGPIPPFGGFVEVNNYSGDKIPAPVRVDSVRYPPSTTSTSSSHWQDDDRHYEGDRYREEVLRHRAITSRDHDRRSDEPDINFGERPRYDKRLRHDDRSEQVFDCVRFHTYSMEVEDGLRAREAARSRYQATPIARERAGPLPMRTRDSPSLNNMPRAADAHPQSAWAIAQSGPEPPEDDVTCPPADPEYIELEELRILKVRNPRERRDGLAPSMCTHALHLLGAWFHCQIQMLDQVYNLCALLAEGQQETYKFFRLTVQNLSAFPCSFRTEGEALLMRHQQELERAYWMAV